MYSGYNLTWRKTHIDHFGGRGVVVVRNPYQAIISYWNWEKTGGHHTKVVPLSTYSTREFKNFAFTGIYRWFELIDDWIKFGKDLYFVFYENLKDNPVEEIKKLMLYLGLEVDHERLGCLANHLAGSFHRISNQTENPFTEEHELMISSVVEKVDRILWDSLNIKMPIYKREEKAEP